MFDLVPFRRRDIPQRWRGRGRSDIFSEMESLMEGMFRDFDACFGNKCHKVADGTYTVQVEVPGFNKDNLTVEVGDGIATIKGEREFDQEKQVGQAKVYKQFSVGEPENVTANVTDGILTLTLVYKTEEPKKVQIGDSQDSTEEKVEEVIVS